MTSVADPPTPAGSPSRSRLPTFAGRSDLALALEIVAGCLLLGVAVGVGWGLLAPHAKATVGYVEPCINEVDCAGFFDAEVYFGVAVALAGIAAAAVAYALQQRHAGPALAVALALGGAVGALAAARIGIWIGHGPSAATLAVLPPSSRVQAPLRLDTWALILAWPIASTFCFACVVWLTTEDDNRTRTRAARPAQPAQSGGDGRPDPGPSSVTSRPE